MIRFRRADERDLAAAVSVLTAAFAEHEIYREKFRPLFGSSQSYIDFLNRLHAVMLKAAMRHHISTAGARSLSLKSTQHSALNQC